MQNADTDAASADRHADLQALLPWYVNGTLVGQELDAVTRHLGQCAACQADVRHWRSVAAAVHLTPESDTTVSPPTAQFAALMARIDTAAGTGTTHAPWWERVVAWHRNLGTTLTGTSRAVRFALAGQGALIVILAALLLWTPTPGIQAPYRTLTQDTTAMSQHAVRLQLVFADDLRVSDLRVLLAQVQAMVINGPTAMGVYTIAVAAPDATTAEHVLQTLRTHPKVRFAALVTAP